MAQLPALHKRPPLMQNTLSMKPFSVLRCRFGYHFPLLLLLYFHIAGCREKEGTVIPGWHFRHVRMV